MLTDLYQRKINYLRISVTDRCNFRCKYCMPVEGVPYLSHNEILSIEEIEEITKIGAALGISKVRLTGGEPLVRKGIVSLVERLARIDGITDLSMTTNGVLLPKYAARLKSAGLNRVNISLDTLNIEKFNSITRVGDLSDVLRGIFAAKDAGLNPIKINFVLCPNENEEDIDQVKEFCEDNGFQFRIIRQMNLETGEFYPVEGGNGGVCLQCNRLRLTSDGFLVSCLHSDKRISLRDEGIKSAFLKATSLKPKSGYGTKTHQFYNIGG